MFGRKGLPKLDAEATEHLALGYLTAVDEIEAMVDTVKERAAAAPAGEQAEWDALRTLLVRYHTRLLTVAKALPPPDAELAALADEAGAMEQELARIAEALWGFDEARVAGLIMAQTVLASHA